MLNDFDLAKMIIVALLFYQGLGLAPMPQIGAFTDAVQLSRAS